MLLAYGGWWVGTWWKTGHMPPRLSIGQVMSGLIRGSVAWPGGYGLVAVILLLLAAAAVMGLLWQAWRHLSGRVKRTRVDKASRYLGAGTDLESVGREHALAVAHRLQIPTDAATGPGVFLGYNVADGQAIYGSYEDVLVMLAGPRTGKTTCFVVPAILAAPGPVLTTSNKSDVVEAIRERRSQTGRVWVFDPQDVAGERQSWWWNPLTFVTDDIKARQMAGFFATSSSGKHALKDSFFDAEGESLLSYFLLAAAVGRRPITQVWSWLTDENNREAVDLLRGEYPLIAQSLKANFDLVDRTKSGVFSTARKMAVVLTNSQALRWVTAPPDGIVPQFSPERFVTSHDTVCLLSREGAGTAGALVLSLTAAVVEAAERQARHEGGRLHTPMFVVLDEAANVCRWRELPDLYSHYGSRAIILMTFLQGWSQGTGVWGVEGMEKMWSAANIKIYGGGIAEVSYLNMLSKLLGEYDRVQRQVGFARGQQNVTQSLTRDSILQVDELAALPRGRAVLLASGARPCLLRTVPWMESSAGQPTGGSDRESA